MEDAFCAIVDRRVRELLAECAADIDDEWAMLNLMEML